MISKENKGSMANHVFKYHCDSIAIDQSQGTTRGYALGLSSLDGNIWNGCVKIISLPEGNELASRDFQCGIPIVRYHHSNTVILAGRDDGNISILSPDDLDELQVIPAHDDIVTAICSNKFNSQFASASFDGYIKIWDITADGVYTPVCIFSGHTGNVTDICFSNRSQYELCSIGQDGFVRLWDQRQSRDCIGLFSIGQPGSAILWDPHSESNVIAGTDSGTLLFINFEILSKSNGINQYKEASTTVSNNRSGRIRRIIGNKDKEDVFIIASDDTYISVLERKLIDQMVVIEAKEDDITKHTDYVTDIAWVDHEKYLVSSSTDKTVGLTMIKL